MSRDIGLGDEAERCFGNASHAWVLPHASEVSRRSLIDSKGAQLLELLVFGQIGLSGIQVKVKFWT